MGCTACAYGECGGIRVHTCGKRDGEWVDSISPWTPGKPVTADVVEHPPHYKAGPFECRDVIAALGLNFNRGSALKYLWRAGRKQGADEAEDIRKAIECLKHDLKRLESKP
jgi:hypothetical protein